MLRPAPAQSPRIALVTYRLACILALALQFATATVSHAAPRASPASDFAEGGIAVIGDSLDEILYGLRGSRRGDYALQVLAVKVLRTDVDPLEVYSERAFRRAERIPDASYAIVAHVSCRSEIERTRYAGHKSSWYMFERGKLVAFDHHVWEWRCVVADQFHPASPDRAHTENALRAWMNAHFPRSQAHVAQYYAQGIAYARIGRLREAEDMLAAGDSTLDASPHAAPRREGARTAEVVRDTDRARTRARLELEIANARTRMRTGALRADD